MNYVVLLLIISLLNVSSLIAPVKNENGEVDVASLSNHVLLLEQMYSGLSSKYEAKLAEVDTKLNSRLDSVNAQLTSVKSDLLATNTTLTAVRSDLQVKTIQLTDITSAIAKIRTPVSFEVTLTAAEFSILNHEVLKFDNVMINEGNGYSKTSGIFTAPVTGTYLFWVHIYNHGSTQPQGLDIHIMKEGVYVVRASAATLSSVASATALFHLTKGEQVWFIKYEGSLVIYGHSLSSYGGTLLSAD